MKKLMVILCGVITLVSSFAQAQSCESVCIHGDAVGGQYVCTEYRRVCPSPSPSPSPSATPRFPVRTHGNVGGSRG